MDLPSDLRREGRCDGCGRSQPHERMHEETCESCSETRRICEFCATWEPFTDAFSMCAQCVDLALTDSRECAGTLEE